MVMKKQETFTDIEYSFRKKKTKRVNFGVQAAGARTFSRTISEF